MILGKHNVHLTAIQANDASLTPKWTGDADGELVETLLEGEDRLGQIWRDYLAIPSNLDVTTPIEPGDLAVYERDDDLGVSISREIRDLSGRSLFGITRLHFADR